MRWIRLFITLIKARRRTRLLISEPSILPFTVWLTDIDVSIMNHAAMMTVMETGRVDFMVRTGFLKLARKNRWYFPSSSIQVQFFRPLKFMQHGTLVTRVFYIDEQWIFMEHKITTADKLVATAVVKCTIKKGRAHVNVLEVLKELNIGDPPTEGTDLIQCVDQQSRLVKERWADHQLP